MTELIKTKENFRVQTTFQDPKPFGARSTGCYIISKNWRGRETVIRDVIQVHWTINDEMDVMIKNKKYHLGPGYVFLYLPGDLHIIRATTETAEYRWFTIDGPLALSVIKHFQFPPAPIFAGLCPEDLFIQLGKEIQDISPYGQRKAASTAYQILSLAKGLPRTRPRVDQIINQTLDIISSCYSDPELNVNIIADRVAMHRSRLSRLFRDKMNITLIDYLISVRINRALSLLSSSTLPISEIARQTGYKDPDYFAKSFKKLVGKSPRVFRLNLSGNQNKG